MACFLLACESSDGADPAAPLAPVASALQGRGHTLHVVLRDLAGARAALGALADAPELRLWQAPLWLQPPPDLPPPVSYAELLLRAGYLDAERLRGPVRGWRQLFAAIGPDLLLAAHAPTALLAARLPGSGQPRRRALIGSGFFEPPALAPMPGFREWRAADGPRLTVSEARALATVNGVLAAEGAGPPLAALHELASADATFLLTWPELDPYAGSTPAAGAGRPGGRYWGLLPGRSEGAEAAWPDGSGPRLLVHLQGGAERLDPVLGRLGAGPWRSLACVDRLAPAQRQRWQTAFLRLSDGPLAMDVALAQADAVLCDGGSTMVGAALRAGRPLLLLPARAEQWPLSRCVAAAGAGRLLLAAEVESGLRAALDAVLADGPLRHAAQALARRHAADPTDVAQRVAARCEALAGGG